MCVRLEGQGSGCNAIVVEAVLGGLIWMSWVEFGGAEAGSRGCAIEGDSFNGKTAMAPP